MVDADDCGKDGGADVGLGAPVQNYSVNEPLLIAGGIGDNLLEQDEESGEALMGMPNMSGPTEGLVPIAPNMAAFDAYQPQFELSFQPIALQPNNNENLLLQNLELHAQPVLLSDTDPNSPYYWDPDQSLPTRRMTIVNIDHGRYEGEVDPDGMRVNVGKCTWADGSYYRGDWA